VQGDVQQLKTDLQSMRNDFNAKITAMQDGLHFDMPVNFAFNDATVRDFQLRTPQWTYVVVAPSGTSHQSASAYVEYQLYDLFADPHQLVNLAGRRETREICAHLRDRLISRLKEAGEEQAEIAPAPLYP